MQTPHLSDAQLRGYRDRALAPQELIAVTDHLAACSACREQMVLYVSAPPIRHLEFEDLEAVSAGRGTPEVQAHLASCAMCRAEADDLRTFRAELEAPVEARVIAMPRRNVAPRWLAAAAAVVVIAGLGTWWASRPGGSPAPAVVAEAKLPADLQQKLDRVLTARALPASEVLKEVVRQRGVLLAAGEPEKSFFLTSPVGTTVLDARPEFHWAEVAGATSYRVSVFDQNFQPVADSGPLTAASWRPETDLPRSTTLIWQVAAKAGAREMRAPIPPAPEARLQVVAAEVAARIAAVAAQYPNQHVLLATLCAEAGALDEADRHLDAAGPAAPAGLRTSLRSLR